MQLFKSKKFWVALIGAIIVAVGKQFGLTEEQAMNLAVIITGWLLAQGAADLGKHAK